MADSKPNVIFLGSKIITDLPQEVRKKEDVKSKLVDDNFIEFFCLRKNLSKNTRICLGIFVFLVLLAISCLVCYFVLTWQGWLNTEKPDGAFKISLLYPPSKSKLGIYDHAAVSTDAAPCAEIGKNILFMNGSAVDAAIATLSCMGVVNPQSSGLGGGFIMTIYEREKRNAVVLDARETAPKAATPNMFEGNQELSKTGGKAVAIPAELVGYEDLHNFYGKLEWKDLFTSTIELCRKGFPVGSHLASMLAQHRGEIFNESSLREIFVNNKTGDVFKENEIMTRNDLADTFVKIAKYKGDPLYAPGEDRKKFVEEIKEFGGIITEDDLSTYAPMRRQPTVIKLKNNYTVYSTPSPGSGELLSFMLNILDGYNLTQNSNWITLDQIVSTFHRIIETFKFAYAQRMQLEDSSSGNPIVRQVIENLLSREYADATRMKIYENKTINDPEYYGVKINHQNDNHGTAHLSVVAPNGDAVAVTSTINLYFGSKRRSRSTGIILNNQMDDFSLPNITNFFGLRPTEVNQIAPGKRPMSSMCPTIITDENDDVYLVIGGNGGTQITSGTALVATQILWLEKTIKEAIDMPRVHHQIFPDHISYEDLFPKQILVELQKFGHHIDAIEGRSSVIMGIHRGADGKLYANADHRKGGSTDGF